VLFSDFAPQCACSLDKHGEVRHFGKVWHTYSFVVNLEQTLSKSAKNGKSCCKKFTTPFLC